MEHRQAKTDEFFTKITSPPHNIFGGESGLSFLKERRHRRLLPSHHAFVQRENTFQESNTAKWKRVDCVVAGRIREIRLLWPEFLLLSLDDNYEILARMIQITLSRITGDVPGQPLLQQIGAGQVQPLIQPGAFLLGPELYEAVLQAKTGFMRTHVGIPGVQLVQGPDGEQQEIELPLQGGSSGEFLEIYDDLDNIDAVDIIGSLWDSIDTVPYVWITFWLELTGQKCGPNRGLVGAFIKRFKGIPVVFETLAAMNEDSNRWDLLHEFLVKFEKCNGISCFPGQIDSQEMNTFRDFLNGPHGGEAVIRQLIDFATEVIELFNGKWKHLAEAFPIFWYSAFEPGACIYLADARPFYEMFLMFSRTAPRNILVQVIGKSAIAAPLEYNTVWTVNGTTRYRLAQPDANDPENMQDKKLDDLVLRAVEDDHMREKYSENVEPDILVEDAFWDIKPANIPAGPGAGLLTFFKKPKIQKVHLFGPRESGTRCCRIRFMEGLEMADDRSLDPDTHLPNKQKFPSQVIMERSDWTDNARENTLVILKALSAAYPTYTQVVNVTNNGPQPNFAPQGFIYRQVLFLFKVNGKEPQKHYASNTPIKILPDILVAGNHNQSFLDYIDKRKKNEGEPFHTDRRINPQQFTALIRDLVGQLDTGRIVWI